MGGGGGEGVNVNLSWTPHSSPEKDKFQLSKPLLSCVSKKMGCLGFNLIVFASVHSLNHSTTVRQHSTYKILPFKAFINMSVKCIILHCYCFDRKINILLLNNVGGALSNFGNCSKTVLQCIYTVIKVSLFLFSLCQG